MSTFTPEKQEAIYRLGDTVRSGKTVVATSAYAGAVNYQNRFQTLAFLIFPCQPSAQDTVRCVFQIQGIFDHPTQYETRHNDYTPRLLLTLRASDMSDLFTRLPMLDPEQFCVPDPPDLWKEIR